MWASRLFVGPSRCLRVIPFYAKRGFRSVWGQMLKDNLLKNAQDSKRQFHNDPTRFWKVLCDKNYRVEEAKYDGDLLGEVITLPDGIKFPHEASNRLFVRQWQTEVYHMVRQRMLHQDKGREECGVLVTGSPGIGKSWWLEACLLFLASEGTERPTVFFESVARGCAWLFFPDGVVQTKYTGQYPSLKVLCDPSLVYLFDPCGKSAVEPTLVYANTWIASSPNKANYQQFDKRPNTYRLYVPTWSLDELLAFAPFCSNPISLEQVIERYAIHGGVVRDVFAKNPDEALKKLNGAISNSNFTDILKAVHEPEDGPVLSHKILNHMVVTKGPDAYREYSMGFASPWISDKIINSHLMEQRDRLIAIAKGDVDLGGVIRGSVYQALGHPLLQKLVGKEIEVWLLTPDGQNKSKTVTITDVSVPRSNISVIDAYGGLADGQKVVFNFTIDPHHGIKSRAMNDFLASTEMDKAMDKAVLYVWIVPPDIKQLFKLQPKKPSSGPKFRVKIDQAIYVMDVGSV